jgi:transposase
MWKRTPTITESADALPQHRKQAKDPKKRQRLQALYMVASGHARYRQEVADLLGVHRHSVAAWFEAYAAGGWSRCSATRSRARPSASASRPPR